MSHFYVIIPARFDSQRFPGKVLAKLQGKSILQHVYERSIESGARKVWIATDHEKVKAAAEAFGAAVCLTRNDHQSGTDRVAEAAKTLGLDLDDILVNVQGDEPLIAPENIKQAAKLLAEDLSLEVSTLCTPITDNSSIFDPNIVKVVMDKRKRALYFSRAAIPWQRDSYTYKKRKATPKAAFRHIGLYAYRMRFLQEYVHLPQAPIETDECLEQLRVLWHGHSIQLAEAEVIPAIGVDTPEDLEKLVQSITDR